MISKRTKIKQISDKRSTERFVYADNSGYVDSSLISASYKIGSRRYVKDNDGSVREILRATDRTRSRLVYVDGTGDVSESLYGNVFKISRKRFVIVDGVTKEVCRANYLPHIKSALGSSLEMTSSTVNDVTNINVTKLAGSEHEQTSTTTDSHTQMSDSHNEVLVSKEATCLDNVSTASNAIPKYSKKLVYADGSGLVDTATVIASLHKVGRHRYVNVNGSKKKVCTQSQLSYSKMVYADGSGDVEDQYLSQITKKGMYYYLDIDGRHIQVCTAQMLAKKRKDHLSRDSMSKRAHPGPLIPQELIGTIETQVSAETTLSENPMSFFTQVSEPSSISNNEISSKANQIASIPCFNLHFFEESLEEFDKVVNLDLKLYEDSKFSSFI